MLKTLFLFLVSLPAVAVMGQSSEYRLNVSVGGSINHYNGNLGSSLFQFKTTCFAGVQANFNYYLNPSLDLTATSSIGRFGYCSTDEDNQRLAFANQQCQGESCKDLIGMGDLRSQIVSTNVALKYKLNNGWILDENTRISPYVFGGVGVSFLSDVMQRDCVNEGVHFTMNAGAGFSYNITKRLSVGYSIEANVFMLNKAYFTLPVAGELTVSDPRVAAPEDRKDICMRNGMYVGWSW